MRFFGLSLMILVLTGCTIFHSIREDNMEPGYQYAKGNKDKLLISSATGLADLNNDLELTKQHIMPVFSMTKTITAIAILQLLERGQLKLEDSINSWIKTPYPDEVTIKHLITHTSGIANPIPLKWVYLPESSVLFDENNELKKLMSESHKLKSQPGSKYRYSNLGYWLAGKVIEKVSNKSYQTYIEENVLSPLKLSNDQVSFTINESKIAKGYLNRLSAMGVIAPFLLDEGLLTSINWSWAEVRAIYVFGPSYGGIFSTAEGMLTILQDLLKDQSTLLNDKSKTLLFSQQKNSKGQSLKMTFGWHTATNKGRQYLFKEGGGAGYHSEMRIYPKEKLASVIIANRTSYDVSGKLTQLD